MSRAIRFQAPLFPSSEAIEEYFELARTKRWFSNFGPCAELLSSRLRDATGRPCVLVANATLGLIAGIAALCREATNDGAEALVPSFAFAASAQCAVWNGLNPVFVDVDRDHWHLDPEALRAALEARHGRIAVVIALSSFGVPPPPEVRERWQSLCDEAHVPLIVDSAAGFGAMASDGVPIGAQGDVEVVSFHALKPLSAGEGGAVFCRDEEIAERITQIANFAFDEDHQVQSGHGLNAKMSELNAAAALAGLDELGGGLATRRELAGAILSRIPSGFQTQVGHAAGAWQFIPVAAPDTRTRLAVLVEAARRDIGARTYYDPLHLMPAFANCAQADDLETTTELGSRMLSLPLALDLSVEEVDAIAGLVTDSARTAHAMPSPA